ncbi:MAG: InlB B-repeat-containing protein, partial [Clostridia bacterium]|nr:InlB B-repeat-containing protein [Clostridia bacterium]
MKKIVFKVLILCMAICSALCVFAACGGGTNIELSFVVDNEIVQTVKTTGSELIEIPDDPEKTGYTFDGWYWDKDVWEKPFTANSLLNAPISKNMSIYAKFKAIEYTATFMADEEQVGTAKFTIEDTEIANIPQVPEKVGYKGVWEEYTIKTEDITINAVYIINKYTVIWQNEDGTVLKTDENVEHGTVLEYDGETPQKAADAQYTYTFDKWEPVVSEITGDITYTATYSTTVNKYTVVWKNYDGTVLETDNDVPYGEMPEYNGAEPTKTENQQYSYVFKNEWSPVVETVKGNSEYIAQFIQVTNKYKITFYDEDGTTKLGESTVDYGTNATYPNDTPTKASDNGYNYTFNKWLKLETTEEDNLENVIDNREVYAKYTATPRVYNVYYVENGGNDINNTTYTYSVGLSVLPDENDISRTGYTFEGWKDAQNNAITAISTEMYGDITLYADWQTITYYASFYADATLVDTKPFTVEDTAIANIPAVPEKTGYTGEWEGYAILAENITINAVYAPIECTITYVNIKTATNNNQTKYNIESEKITLADLDNIDGYNFNCWLDEDGNKITEITSGSFGHREITAKWDIVEFTIDYADVKTAINNNIIKYTIESDTIILINLDNIDGYNFNCWLDEKGNKITEIPTGSFGNREIAAKWDLVEFDIVYANIKTATNNNITKYTIESDTITLINLNDIDGYNFNCWLDEKGNKITEIPAGSFGNREITAKWDLVEFDISYTNLKTASNGNKVKYTIESAKITLIDLDNIDGYNFNCWLDEDDNKITEIPAGSFGNREITAKWDVIEFTINYADVKTAANNNLTKYTIESAKITLADLDNIDGYNFNCWLDEDGNKITEIPAGSFGHREITAKWDLVEFDLILNYEAERGDYAIGTSNPNKYTIESDITLTELVCNNTGYIFIGWFTEKNNGTGVKVERIKDRTGTISLYAQWDLEDYSITYYGVNNAVNTNLSNYTVETETFTIDNLSRTGYTFDGWFNSDDTVANTTITKGSIGNKAFYAKWTAIEYDIEYVLYDGTYVADENPAKYTIESSIVFNGLTKDGYRFDGWFDAAQGGNKLTGISVGTCGNKTVYAHWTYISTITYNSNGGSAVSPTINPAGTVITAPVAPTKDYYEFVGWFNSSLTEEFVFEVQPSEDITLYAKWEPVKYNITYVLNGGNNGNNPAQYTVEQKVELKDASKTGYTFVGWFTDELFTSVTVEEISLGSHGEIVLYANYSINQYTISFETNGGTTIADITQNYATTVNAPSDPAKNGYTFSGWYFDSALKNAYTFTTMPADNITVYAKWTLVNYGITYNLNGGTNGNNPAKYTITSSDITLKNPTKTGYEFKGWFTDSNYQNAITVIANGSYGDIELFAKWKIITYTVTYVLPDGATHTNPTSYTIETATVSLTDAEKTGYTFNGWFDAAMNGNSVTTFAGGAIGNLTIYGRFTVNDYTVWLDGSEEAAYTVEFNLNGKNGTAPAMQTITENNTLKYPTVPTCEGYVFAGWFDNENCEGKAFDFAAIVNENTVLYAKWIAVGGNNVISVNGTAVVTLNGANDITYMFVPLNSGNVTITTTGSYDTFGALYSDQGVKLVQDDDTGTDSNFQIIYNVTANKAYYIKVRAYSSAITGTCTLYLSGDNTVADGGYTVTSSKTTVTFDADFTLAVPEARDGYKFLGWQDENGVLYTDGTGASVKTWDKAETTVLYSKWERTVYTINFVTNGGSAVDPVTFAFGDRIDLNDYVTTLANKSFLGWYASNTDTERYNATYMPDHNLTLYAKWTNYALGEIKYNADKVAIKETDELTAELFGAVCLDTDGNFANITVTLSGTQVAGETVSIRLVATNNGKTKQKTVSGVRVYGIPTLTFDNTVDYLNLKDGLTAEWIRAIGTDSFGGSTEIRFTIAVEKYPNNYYPVHSLNDCNGGDHIVANIYAVDAAGNQKMLTTGGLIVYDLPVITYKEEKTAISVNNVINAELFSATATDSCGENLTVSVMVYDGTISAGNTVTIRLTAIDSKGNIQIIDKQVEVYGMPTIDNATTLDFKVEDEITVNSLGLTAKDTYNNPLEIALTVKSGTQTAGATMVFTATVTDIAGNITTKDISAKIYGTPTITYNRNALKVSENPTSNANLLNTVAKDSFDGGLTVTATLKSGELKGGEYVVYTLTAVDKLGNVATIDTALIPVYAVNDIKFTDNVNYFSGATDTIKLDSKGEEFYASITDTFGGLCDITIEPATGYTLKAGNTIDIHLVATDKAGNSVRSDLITGIKVYGTPTYVMNQDVVYEDTDLDFFFTVYDSFGEELYYEIIVEGEQVGGKVITISLAATDDFGNSLNEQLIVTVSVGNLIFTKNTDGSAYILSSFSGNVSEAIIPTEFGGIPVTAIAARVFERCTNLTKVVIPDSVTTIGMRAFAMCSKLTNVTIGSSVTSIGDEAFSGCSSLTSITIPDSVTSIGSSAFYNCSGLTSVTIGNSVTSIGNSAFNNCSSLTSITIPNSVTSIGDEAFSGCSSLTSITIPDSVTSIGSSAFYNCSGLT